jgi:prepilin-type N-terminal cleavage/methylation domain-containing protein
VRELFLFRKTDYYLSITIMSTKSRQKGFTIVELMVTIVVAGFIIPAVAVALTNLAVEQAVARPSTGQYVNPE